MPFDPFADPFADPFGAMPFRTPRQQAEPLPPLEPQQEEGILSRLGQTALGGLGYIGGSLDKALGGRAIRGLLGGRPEELASLIPFSDAMGITNEANAVSGKELLGYDDKDDSWSGLVGGTLAEMALDPGSYLTFGGKTLLGKAATKANALPKVTTPTTTRVGNIFSELNPLSNPRVKGQLSAEMRGVGAGTPEAAKIAAATGQTAADVADQPLSALATLSLPFGEKLGMPGTISLGTGKGAQRVADKLSSIKDYGLYSGLGRAVSPLFDARLSEFGTPGRTEVAQRNVRAQADALAGKLPDVMGQHLDERKVMSQAGIDMLDPAQADPVNQAMRQYVEGFKPTTALPPEVESMNVAQIQELMARREQARQAGRLAPKLTDDPASYFPRGMTKGSDEGLNDPTIRAALGPINPNDIRREAPLRDIPLGTAGGENPLLAPGGQPIGGLNQLFEDPLTKAVPAVAASVGNRAKYVRRKYLGFSKGDEQEYATLIASSAPGGAALTPQQVERLAELQKVVTQSEQLVNKSTSDITTAFGHGLQDALNAGKTEQQFGREIRKQFKDKGYAPFQNSPLGDMHQYRLADDRSNAAATAALSTLRQSASRHGGEGMVKLSEALKGAGYDNPNAIKLLGGKKAIQSMFVPAEVAADLTQRTGFKMPGFLQPIMGAVDSVTNLNKAFQTKFFPSTILRNLFGEGYVNAAGKTGNVLGDMREAMRVRAGEGLESLAGHPLFAGLSPDEALKKYDELAFQYGVQKPFGRAAMDDIIGRGARDANPGTLSPIGERGDLWQAAKDAGTSMVQGAKDMRAGFSWNPMNWNWGGDNPLNPLGMAGVGGRAETTNAAGFLGEQAMQAADQLGKHGAFLGLLKQGYDPAVAAEQALSLRMGARKLAPFENEVMRRLVPYYRWSSHNIPHMASELLHEPGGLVGQSIRATNAVRQNEGIMPDWIGEGVAMPLGDRDETGTQRYLTSLGLPFEDLAKVASAGPNAGQRTLQKILANLNPLLKNPLEAATGTQLYSGRDLADLYARSGSPTAEGLIGMTPLSRPLNVVSTLLDPRKGALGAATNVLSPGRVSDVDMNRASQIQGRRLLENELRTNPLVREHTDLYVPADQRANMSPEEVQLLQLYRTLLQRAREQRPAPAAQAQLR